MSIDLKEYTFGANDMVIVLADQIVQQQSSGATIFVLRVRRFDQVRPAIPVLPAVPADPVTDQRRSPDSLKAEEVVSVLEYCSFLRQRVNMRDNCFRQRSPRACSMSLFYEFGQYHEQSCSRRRTAGENASGRSVRTVHSSGGIIIKPSVV